MTYALISSTGDRYIFEKPNRFWVGTKLTHSAVWAGGRGTFRPSRDFFLDLLECSKSPPRAKPWTLKTFWTCRSSSHFCSVFYLLFSGPTWSNFSRVDHAWPCSIKLKLIFSCSCSFLWKNPVEICYLYLSRAKTSTYFLTLISNEVSYWLIHRGLVYHIYKNLTIPYGSAINKWIALNII